MNTSQDIEQLIARSLNGECSQKEYESLMAWMETSSENRQLYFKVKDTWDASLYKKKQADQALLSFYKNQANKKLKSSKSITIWKWSSAIAAILLIGIIISSLLNLKSDNNAMVSYRVPLGSRSELVLSDGTKVSLNSGTEISYPSSFNTDYREVILSGEAYFEVKSDLEHPFIVKTSDLDVNVTGTKFNVCTYDDDQYTSVTLLEGKVGLKIPSRQNEYHLVQGKKVELSRVDNKLRLYEPDLDAEIAWKDGKLSFKAVAFSELIKRLERWYDVELYHDSPELNSMVYNGSFKNQETIWQVLDALSLTTSITYKKNGHREFEIIYKPM